MKPEDHRKKAESPIRLFSFMPLFTRWTIFLFKLHSKAQLETFIKVLTYPDSQVEMKFKTRYESMNSELVIHPSLLCPDTTQRVEAWALEPACLGSVRSWLGDSEYMVLAKFT